MILRFNLLLIVGYIYLMGSLFGQTFKEEYPDVNICYSHTLSSANIVEENEMIQDLQKIKRNNCTHLFQRVYIRSLKSVDVIDLSRIEEISGDLSIDVTSAKVILLTNLKVIRGHLYKVIDNNGRKDRVSLDISANSRLEYIDLRNLRSVYQHGVAIINNPKLKFIPNSIHWNSVLYNPATQPLIFSGNSAEKVKCSSKCGSLNGTSYCWGPSDNDCQHLLYPCDAGFNECKYCYTSSNGNKGCCNDQCLGGCNGFDLRKCHACLNVRNGDKCAESCPSKYVSSVSAVIPNINFKLQTTSFCSKQCPDEMYPENIRCVYKCSNGYQLNEKKECVQCSGSTCDKPCNIQEIEKSIYKKFIFKMVKPVLEKLTNCTSLSGYFVLGTASFQRHGVTEELLRKHLKNVRYIHGGINYVFDTNLKSMSFFENLVSIKSFIHNANEQVVPRLNKILITETALESLGWKSFKLSEVTTAIHKNSKLCYMDVPWDTIVTGNKGIKENGECKDKVCGSECVTSKGCWGPGNSLCFECKSLNASGTCVSACTDVKGHFLVTPTSNITGVDVKNQACVKCHEECAQTCNGLQPNQCIGGCRNKDNNGVCVPKCPLNTYEVKNSNKCYPCNDICLTSPNQQVCTGPLNKPGVNGCNMCSMIQIDHNKQIKQCVSKCPNGTYRTAEIQDYVKWFQGGIGLVCAPCDPLCGECKSGSVRKGECLKCRGVWYADECENKCPQDDSYGQTNATDGDEIECLTCSKHCKNGCSGPTSSDCKDCKDRKIYLDNKKIKYYCNDSCPLHKPIEEMEQNTNHVICVTLAESRSNKEELKRTRVTLATVFSMLILVIIVIIITVLCLRQKAKKERLEADVKAFYSNLKEPTSKNEEALSQPPNMGRLAIINIDDLIFEDQTRPLGFGAFGYVYKGKWRVPKDDDPFLRKAAHDFYLAVAIKVIKNLGNEENDAIMQEAKIMASVSHKHCLRFIGVCLSYEKPCLVTAFVKEGSLDKYLVRNKTKINSLIMLSWAEQIADGMLYLSRRGIIHRDLATRNVLVSGVECVQITDFGLSKMLENITDKEIVIKSGRVPIRWLAIETLTEGRYSHETDVWAYGVTLWEMFTFGKIPYEDQATTDIADFVLKGGRLPQPDICSLDVYIVLINCWLESPNLRPDFEHLMKTFTNYCKNPGRYLSIAGDPFEIPSPTSDNNFEMSSNLNNPYLDNIDNAQQHTAETTLPLLYNDKNKSRYTSLVEEGNGNNNNNIIRVNRDTLLSNSSSLEPEPLPTRSTKSHSLFKNFYNPKSNKDQTALQTQPSQSKPDDNENHYVSDPVDKFVQMRNPPTNKLNDSNNNNNNSNKYGSTRPLLMSETPRFHSNNSSINNPRNTGGFRNTRSPPASFNKEESQDDYLEPVLKSTPSVNNDTDGYLEPGLNNSSIYVEPDCRNSAGSSQPITNNRSTLNSSSSHTSTTNPNQSNTNQYLNDIQSRLSKEIPNIDDEERSPASTNLYFPQLSNNNNNDDYLEPKQKSRLVKMEHDSFS